MPQMGVSVSEGTVTKWLKSVGDHVDADESIVEISTDKVDTEVPSPGSGTLTEILVDEGQTVAVGTLLGRIGGAEEPARAEAPPEPATPAAVEAAIAASSEGVTAPVAEPEQAFPAPPTPAPAPETAAAPAPEPESHNGQDRAFVSPVVARIAAEHGIDPASIPGSGHGGRVTKKDILAFVESKPAEAPAEPAPAEPPAPAAQPAPAAHPEPASNTSLQGTPAPAPAPAPPAAGEQVEPMNAMRRGIAEHMRRSLDTAAHVTSAIEVDMSKVSAIREKLKPEYQKGYGVNPTYLAFVARATVDTLRDWPWVTAELRGESIVTHSFVNLGFAVALEGGKGLIVPVVKNAEGLNLLGMARAIADLAERARSKKLLPDNVQGGTFTITNPGSFGTFHGTPVINQPQSGILGTYAVVKRPWVIQDENGNDAIAIRPIMNVTLTYDHRIVDGAYAGGFLRELREKLETWSEPDY